MIVPTKRQQSILKGLLNDDDWVAMLNDIDKDCEIRPWKPSKEKSEDEKNSQWIFDSGKQRGVSDILTLFRLTT